MKGRVINTAPRDGTDILLFFADQGWRIGHWHDRVIVDHGETKTEEQGWAMKERAELLPEEAALQWQPLPDDPPIPEPEPLG